MEFQDYMVLEIYNRKNPDKVYIGVFTTRTKQLKMVLTDENAVVIYIDSF